jgi:hypothetical protein
MSAREEQIKLTASWLNTIAAGCVVAGGVGPSIKLILFSNPPVVFLFVFFLVWFAIGTALHMIARAVLKRL